MPYKHVVKLILQDGEEGRKFMNKSDIKKLQDILAKEDTLGKKLLERVIWLNTTSSKYKVNDFVKFTDPGHRIYGVPVKDFRGKVVKIISNSSDKFYTYQVEIEVVSGDKSIITDCYIQEKDIAGKVRSNKNIITPVDKEQESIGLSLTGSRSW